MDEALSSLQNFVVLFAALRYLDVSALGQFTLAYTGALLLESVLRSFILEPLAIRFSAVDQNTLRLAARACLGASVVVCGLLVLVVAGLGTLLMDSSSRTLLLMTAAAVPALVVQEAWRVYFFTAAAPRRAVVNELACLASTFGLAFWLLRSDVEPSAENLVAVWAVGTAVGAVLGVVQSGVVPSIKSSASWLSRHWRLGGSLAGGSSIEQFAGRISLTLIAGIAGDAALGKFSAARTLMTPATTAVSSTMNFAVPEAVRMRSRNDPRLRLFLSGHLCGPGGRRASCGPGLLSGA